MERNTENKNSQDQNHDQRLHWEELSQTHMKKNDTHNRNHPGKGQHNHKKAPKHQKKK